MPTTRVRVLDAEDIAKDYVRTFNDRDVRKRKEYKFGWPSTWKNVGDSLAVAYASDKWKNPGEHELYKHLAESRNRCFVQPGLLRDWDTDNEWPVIGPMTSFDDVPMPRHFATLGFFEEANFKLYTKGTDEDPRFGKGKDDGCVAIGLRHAYLGASKMLWSQVGKGEDQPFLFVYTNQDGPLILIVGEKLDVEKDGIVG